MKNLLNVIVFLLFTSFSAQSVSDYAYVYIPKTFEDFKTENRYNLNKMLAEKFQSKSYKIFDDENFPVDRCDVLTAVLLDDSNMFRNRVKLEVKDCYGKVLASHQGTSMIKDFGPGFKDAMERAFANIPVSANDGSKITIKAEPKPQNVTTEVKRAEPVNEKPAQAQPKMAEKPVIVETKPIAKTENQAEVFSNGSSNYNKVNLGVGHFIFTSPNSSVPYAIFKESMKKEVYRVQLENGIQTLGYTEGNKLIVEIPQGDGTFRKEEFSRK